MFFSTKHSAHRAKILFGLAGLPLSAELHGNMTQAARLESLERFRKVSVRPLPCLEAVSAQTVHDHTLPACLESIPGAEEDWRKEGQPCTFPCIHRAAGCCVAIRSILRSEQEYTGQQRLTTCWHL